MGQSVADGLVSPAESVKEDRKWCFGRSSYTSFTAVKFSHENPMKLEKKSTWFYGEKGIKMDLYFRASYVKISLRNIAESYEGLSCILRRM